jgi:threonine/homoserine/homoserine lactone efflux protein
MLSGLLLKGCIIGFSIAMPVGPIGLLCIRHSLAKGMIYGLMSGLGAACADTLFGALGGFGVSAIGLLLAKYHLILEFFGACFLFYLGISTFLERIEESSEIRTREGYLHVFFSTFLLTLTNPMTLISFAGVYAGLGVGALADDFLTPLIITAGVFIGSAIWWLILSVGSSCFRETMNYAARKWLNRISGAIIFGFGVFALTTALRSL